ncbi:hypothetical protein K439DRAFT_1614084 [Ramaria rubella]|nr:hypothetical protein K439DRAFT_1614084 [Ramaria rubella]
MLPSLRRRASLGGSYTGIQNSSQVRVLRFTPLERKGATAIAVIGVTSCTLVSLLLLYIAASALAVRLQKAHNRPEVFITKQIAVFLTCLLMADLIQSIAGVSSVKWAVENQIYEGRSCTIQGATLVFGDLGSTVWLAPVTSSIGGNIEICLRSVVIAAHTFCGITLNRHWSRWMIWVILFAGWLFPIILGNNPPPRISNLLLNATPAFLIPLGITRASKGPYFSIAGTCKIKKFGVLSRCFISSEYAVARLVLHYVPLFTAAATILVLYLLIFLFLRGSIHFLPAEGPEFSLDDIHSKQRVAIAKRMLWYPIGWSLRPFLAWFICSRILTAYCTCVMPVAIVRVLEFHINLPEEALIVTVNFLFALGGVDAIIYATTRALIRPINISFGMSFLSRTSGATSESPMVTPEQPSMYDGPASGDQDVDHGNGTEDPEGNKRQEYP